MPKPDDPEEIDGRTVVNIQYAALQLGIAVATLRGRMEMNTEYLPEPARQGGFFGGGKGTRSTLWFRDEMDERIEEIRQEQKVRLGKQQEHRRELQIYNKVYPIGDKQAMNGQDLNNRARR